MARRESALESWAVAWARFRSIVVAKLTEVAGIPDRIFFMPAGVPVLIEFKRLGKVGKGLQADTQPWYRKKLLSQGYRVYQCDSKEQFKRIMKENGVE